MRLPSPHLEIKIMRAIAQRRRGCRGILLSALAAPRRQNQQQPANQRKSPNLLRHFHSSPPPHVVITSEAVLWPPKACLPAGPDVLLPCVLRCATGHAIPKRDPYVSSANEISSPVARRISDSRLIRNPI